MSTQTTKYPPEVQAMIDAMKATLEAAEKSRLETERVNAELRAQVKSASSKAFTFELTTYTPPGKSEQIPMVQFGGTCKPKQLSVGLVRQILSHKDAIEKILPQWCSLRANPSN